MLHYEQPESLRFHVKPDAVCVRHCPGGTHLQHNRRGRLLSERGRGWRHSDLPRYSARTIGAGIALEGQSVGTYGILAVSRETCV